MSETVRVAVVGAAGKMGAQTCEAVRDAGRSVVIIAGDAEYDSWS